MNRHAVALFFGLLLSCSPVVAAGPLGRSMLEEIAGPLSLSESERRALAPEIERLEDLGGALGYARNTIWVGVTWDCRERCLSELLSGVNDGLESGLGDQRAADLALEALRQQINNANSDTTYEELAHLVANAVSSRLSLLAVCGEL